MSKRALAYMHARLWGYFWLSCPRCGRMFGGHEKHGGIDWEKPDGPWTNQGRVCCPRCPGDRYGIVRELTA